MLATKSQLIVELNKAGEMWDYELVDKVLGERNMLSDYWRNNARFWCTELSGMMVFEDIDLEVDSSHWNGRIAHKYKISPYGQQMCEKMLKE